MKGFLRYRSITVILSLICIIVFVFTRCMSHNDATQPSATTTFNDFAGTPSCQRCHKDIYAAHLKTGHFGTSQIADEHNIAGSFDSLLNKVAFSTGGYIRMEKRGDGFFQVAYSDKGKELRIEPFDMVIGVATQGQSYASWIDNKLVQLPITYFTSAHSWSNSPGYPNKIAFNRPITSRCLECHSTFAGKISAADVEPELFDRNKMILGITCEKCHGPAAKHVAFQTANPTIKEAKYIIDPAKFSRQQSLDMCALCHGGHLQKKTASFEFVAGDNLSDFFVIDTTSADAGSIDVHGNQYGMLRFSKCFRMSQSMTCITCHDPHNNEKGNVALYSRKCLSCHGDISNHQVVCKMMASLGETIKNDCISCHMPAQSSRAIAVVLPGEQRPTPASMHTHLIKSYPEETANIIALIKRIKN